MEQKIKYITYKGEFGPAYITFSELTSHDSHHIDRSIILGAGFVRFIAEKDKYDEITIKFKCYGESTSLGIKSRGEEDSKILNYSKQEMGIL